jgi:hypothetical protein
MKVTTEACRAHLIITALDVYVFIYNTTYFFLNIFTSKHEYNYHSDLNCH